MSNTHVTPSWNVSVPVYISTTVCAEDSQEACEMAEETVKEFLNKAMLDTTVDIDEWDYSANESSDAVMEDPEDYGPDPMDAYKQRIEDQMLEEMGG